MRSLDLIGEKVGTLARKAWERVERQAAARARERNMAGRRFNLASTRVDLVWSG